MSQALPPTVTSRRTTSEDSLDQTLEELRNRAGAWAATPIVEKREHLREIAGRVDAGAQEWVALACDHKHLSAGSPLAGEEWISGPWALLSYLAALGETLDHLAAGRSPLERVKVLRAPGGRIALRVLPHDRFDQLLLNGYTADVWLPAGVTAEQASTSAGETLREPDGGGVSLVLGAGNISSIAPLDALYRLYGANRVVLLKLNPVNDYLGPLFEEVFQPLASSGFIRFAYGGADVGRYLTGSAAVSDVHVTGSAATHDAIVFGTGPEAEQRKSERVPFLHKPVTSELGGVSPTILVPGDWSRADLRYQAQNLATQKLHNAGCNCIATQVLIMARGWPQRDAFMAELRQALQSAPARPGYYPGAEQRQRQAATAYPQAERLGADGSRLLVALDHSDRQELAFGREFFGPVLGHVELAADDLAEFLDRAVGFANERLAGTLGAGMIVRPATICRYRPAVEQAIERLHYGSIAINCWTAVAYLTPRAPWGAFPGHAAYDIQSGSGVVHNALLLSDSERTVVWGPFRPAPRSLLAGELALSPKPPWFVTNRTAAITGRRLTRFAADPSWPKATRVVASAIRG